MSHAATLIDPSAARSWRGRALAVLALSLLAHAWVLKLGRDSLGQPDAILSEGRLIEVTLRPSPQAAATPASAAAPAASVPKARPRAPARPAPLPQRALEPSPTEAVSSVDPSSQSRLTEPPEVSEAITNEPDSSKEESVKDAPAIGAAAAAPPPTPEIAPAASDGPITGEFAASGPAFVRTMGRAPDVSLLPGEARYSYETSDSRFPAVTGRATLTWRQDAQGYAARLSLTAFGIPVLELNSRGRIEAFGFAPERYTEKTVGRSEWATNFDWGGSRVTFSRKTHERPLAEGMQDRLSFQFQLVALGPALLGRLQPGATLVLAIGGRDDTTSYRLKVIGPERVTTPAGEFDAIKLDKEKTPQDESRIEVWLAPDAAWLPVKLRFTDRNGQITENTIAEMQIPKK
jgi:hypothetical protein